MKQADAEWDLELPKSSSILSKKLRRVENQLVFPADVHDSVDNSRQGAIDKLDDRVIKIAKRTVVDALKTFEVIPNKAFIKGTLKSALNGLLVSIPDDSPWH